MRGVLALILAGGQGERLSILSEKRAKPAVPYAGKYRIIDFTLSNCVNSGLYDVGVLTQYRPHSLIDHIGVGKPWDLDRQRGGVKILQPYLGRKDADWYKGTADAVYQNLDFIIDHKSDIVLVLAGDHVYKMNYWDMINFHQERDADVTIAMQDVPLADASRFGIATLDDAGRIVRWDEKPKEPKGTLGSMGVYVFNKDTLIRRLIEDSRRSSKHDFGHDIIPRVLESDRVFAYRFDGYWRDVGTIDTYWDAHQELLRDGPELDLYDDEWRIHTRSEERPPATVCLGSRIVRSMISHGCQIQGEVINSVLSPGVVVEEGARVRDSIIMFDSRIGRGSIVDRCILDKEVEVGIDCRLGDGQDFRANRLEPDRLNTGLSIVGKRAVIPDGTRIGRNCKIAAGVRPDNFASRLIDSGESVMVAVPTY